VLGIVIGATLVLAVFSSVIFTDAFADSIVVNFDKQFYDFGDSLTISGEILEVGMPVIAMSVYDPDGKIISANNLEISSEQTFGKTILLDSPFYEKTGEYLVKLDYGAISENHYFMVEGNFLEPEILIEETVEPEIILLYTEEKQYTDKDVVKITGLVSAIDSPSALIGIYDPFGMPAGFYFGSIDSNLEFTTSFLVKDGVNFRVDGTYSVKAHYAESEATSFFDYYKIPTIVAEEDLSEDKIDENETADEPIDESTHDTDTGNEDKKDSKDQISNSENNSNPAIESKQTESKQIPKNNVVNTKNISEKTQIKKINDLEIKETKITKEKTLPNKIKKENNLTVEDIELGKLLNQINLECDSTTYADTISYYDGMGPALYRLCKFDSSLDFFNESLIQNPNDVEILVNKGSALGKLGYFSEAIVYYDHAIMVDPDFLPAKNNKANALANLGNFKDAILLYDEVLQENPNYLTARENLETLLSSNFDIDKTGSLSDVENTFDPKSTLSENAIILDLEKQNSGNFFDEVGIVFSTLGSLFDFLN
jgi:tetratricopeptide (TPR) repeat protein